MDEQQIVSSDPAVTDQMINTMRPTKMWTKFLSIMGFIGAGMMVLMGIFIMLAGNLFPQSESSKVPPAMGIIYIIFSIFYIVPSVYLLKYSSALGRFLNSKKEFELESALSSQKSFWKFLGIVCIIGLTLMVLGIVAAIVVPLMVKH